MFESVTERLQRWVSVPQRQQQGREEARAASEGERPQRRARAGTPRLVEIDAELNIEAELAAHRLERRLRSMGFTSALRIARSGVVTSSIAVCRRRRRRRRARTVSRCCTARSARCSGCGDGCSGEGQKGFRSPSAFLLRAATTACCSLHSGHGSTQSAVKRLEAEAPSSSVAMMSSTNGPSTGPHRSCTRRGPSNDHEPLASVVAKPGSSTLPSGGLVMLTNR